MLLVTYIWNLIIKSIALPLFQKLPPFQTPINISYMQIWPTYVIKFSNSVSSVVFISGCSGKSCFTFWKYYILIFSFSEDESGFQWTKSFQIIIVCRSLEFALWIIILFYSKLSFTRAHVSFLFFFLNFFVGCLLEKPLRNKLVIN